MSQSIHVSVMPNEIVRWVTELKPSVVIDGTFGGGGHSRLILQEFDRHNKRSDQNSDWEAIKVIGLDRDPDVSERHEANPIDPRIELFIASYLQSPKALAACDLELADAMVLDLGLSSDQLEDRDRGFSFTNDGPLDLRFDAENGIPASEWLIRHKEEEIANSIYQFGEERFSRRIARAIVQKRRQREPVKTVNELVEICRRCVPRSKNHDIHPATRTFQALRIAVNDELGILQQTLQAASSWIRPGGRLIIISFHSLEDRLVKNAFRDDPSWEPLTKKPLRPTDEEIASNPRSRSAKLRIAERVGN